MDNTTRPAEEEGGNLRRPVGYRAVWQSTSDGYVWDGASSRVVPTMRQAQEIIEQWNAMGLVSDALECRVQTLYEDATAAPGAAAAAPISRAEWRAAAKAFYLEAGDDEATATELARYLCDQQDWLGKEVGDPRVEAQEDIQGRPRPAPTHQPGLQAAAGVTPVLIDLLRDCLGPLEVSHAILESDDYGAMSDLILRVKGALDQFDAARAAQAQGGKA